MGGYGCRLKGVHYLVVKKVLNGAMRVNVTQLAHKPRGKQEQLKQVVIRKTSSKDGKAQILQVLGQKKKQRKSI